MRKETVKLLLSTFLLIAVVIGVGFYAYNKLRKDESIPALQTATTPTAAVNQPMNPDNSLQVQSAQSTPQQAETAKLPEPAEFSVYEQFAKEQSVRYIDVVVGSGDEATVGDDVAVVYSGWLTNGQLFDKSTVNEEKLLEPFVFKIGAGSVIRGWDDGIVGMKVGGQRRLIIPSQLAYGEAGAGEGAIPPNAMLIFDVQLAQVQKANP